jgi:hypothetical protein
MRKLLLILPVALVALATAVAVRAAAAPPRSSDPEVARQVSRTFTLRWPRHVAEQEAYVEPIDIPTGQVEKVSVAVAGRRQVGEEPRDYVVACAHRGPSLASKGWLVQGGVVWVTVVLQTGQCKPGPTVAGKAVDVRVTVTTGG